MKIFNLTHIIDDKELEERLSKLAEQYKQINGWSEQEILEFAVNAMPLTKVWLDFMDLKTDDFKR